MIKQTYNNSAYTGLVELLNTEVMNNYNTFIVSMAMKYVSNKCLIVDYGAGIGTLSLIFRDKFSMSPLCFEIDKVNKEYLVKRNFRLIDELSSLDSKVNLVFSSNVLEHIDDDLAVLHRMKNLIKDDGKIFLYLPGKMLLWSKLDEVLGHHRRYECNELIRKCEQVGLKIEKLHYAESLGFFALLVLKLFCFKRDRGIASVSSLRFYDKWLLPLSLALDKVGFKYLFGKNIVLVAYK